MVFTCVFAFVCVPDSQLYCQVLVLTLVFHIHLRISSTRVHKVLLDLLATQVPRVPRVQMVQMVHEV